MEYSQLAICSQCGANWGTGQFTLSCVLCDGGALDRPCPNCGGRCGRRWTRAVTDTLDSREAHWIGACDWRVWVDEARLPERIEALLVGGPDPVVLLLGETHRFPTVDAAITWLSQDGFVPEAELAPP